MKEPETESRKTMQKQHRILIATDGSRSAQAALATAVKFPWPASSCMRALYFLSSLEPGRGGRVVLVNVVEPVFAPASVGRLPSSVRATSGLERALLGSIANGALNRSPVVMLVR